MVRSRPKGAEFSGGHLNATTQADKAPEPDDFPDPARSSRTARWSQRRQFDHDGNFELQPRSCGRTTIAGRTGPRAAAGGQTNGLHFNPSTTTS
jgi:hypothetical protein